jgi:hypothetical protein
MFAPPVTVMMKTTQFPKKFLSLRDKNGSHRRSKSQEKDKEHKVRAARRVYHTGAGLLADRMPLCAWQPRPSSEAFWNLFKSDATRQAAKEEEEREKEAAKVRRRFPCACPRRCTDSR